MENGNVELLKKLKKCYENSGKCYNGLHPRDLRPGI